MSTTKKQTIFAAAAFLLGCMIAAALGTPSAARIAEPLVGFGQWLRSLSLSGTAGNLGAWAVVILISCLPALGLLWKKRSYADLLLALSGAEIFAMLYYLVNPTRISDVLTWIDGAAVAKMWGLVSAGCVAGTLICWALLRFLKNLARKPADILPLFLFWTAIAYAFMLGLGCVQETSQAIQEMTAGNTQQNLIQSSRTMLIVLHILALLPDLMGVWVLLLAGKLAISLENSPFSEETVTLAENISAKSFLIAKLSLLLTVVGNALQLLFFSKLLNVKMEIHVPLLTLVLCAVLMLLCKYFRNAKAIHDDNISII